jgi:Ni/Co efflux regulator RcnB
VHEYYGEALRSGHCPPGLAKKNNGCMPPGQAKKWRVGRPLPRDVVYYQVPQDLVVRLGPPPSGHRYVRVGSDILLLTTNQAIVVDALQNFGR